MYLDCAYVSDKNMKRETSLLTIVTREKRNNE